MTALDKLTLLAEKYALQTRTLRKNQFHYAIDMPRVKLWAGLLLRYLFTILCKGGELLSKYNIQFPFWC